GNGVDIRRFSPDAVPRSESLKRRAEFGIPPDVPVIGMIGRLVREKGYLELVRAAAEIRRTHPDCHFLFVGDALKSDHDASRSEILDLIEQLGLQDRIHIAGLRQDIPELLAAMNIYTLPSWREGMPRSIIEAMAMGLPVVATQIRGCREEVLDGETGFLVPPRDSAALASALRRLLGNPEQARTMGAAGCRRAQHEYAEDLVLDRQLQVFRALIREKGLDTER
ncbi:MAG TPA: glycosyltransferase, partial [Candidatus Sumerlaeota bacterium]|nr:glycosyltransferase [Candidatus Sumerlaeota bacterium]